MKRRTRRRVVFGAVVAGIALVAGGCWSLERMYTVYDTLGPPALDQASIVAIVDAEVVDDAPPLVEGTRTFVLESRSVRYQRGPYPIRGSTDQIDLGAPAEGTTFETITDPGVELPAGSRVTVVLDAWAIEDVPIDAGHRWHIRLALDAAGRPVPGTPASLNDDLAAIREPHDDPVEALVALAEDLEAYGRAIAADPSTVETIPIGDTLARLRAPRPATAAPSPSEWLSRPDLQRQLPLDEPELEALPDEIRAALGTDRWVRWTIVVDYDPTAVGSIAYLGASFPGYGFIGPYAVDPIGFTVVGGMAPPDAPMELVVWGDGIPAETIVGLEDRFADQTISSAERLPLDAVASPPTWDSVPDGGAISVTLDGRRVAAVAILDPAELLDLVEGHRP